MNRRNYKALLCINKPFFLFRASRLDSDILSIMSTKSEVCFKLFHASIKSKSEDMS